MSVRDDLMRDLFDEVPARAYLNAQFIGLGEKFGAFRDAKKLFLREIGVGSYSLMNPALIASLLYCLIVVPKEFWRDRMPSDVVTRLNQQSDEIISLFEFEVWDYRPAINIIFDLTNPNCLLQKLRNAVSHARIELVENGDIIFTDISKGNINFRAKLDQSGLNIFLRRLDLSLRICRVGLPNNEGDWSSICDSAHGLALGLLCNSGRRW